MNGFYFNGKHTFDDWGMSLAPGTVIGTPSKKKIKVEVPFSNVVYDFSEVYGGQMYEERTLVYKLNVNEKSLDYMYLEKTAITNWLMNTHGKQKLYDDRYPGYYFLAEVESEASMTIDSVNGVFEVKFIAYPFMISELKEGHDIWDEFNFLLDIAQTTDFSVGGEKNIVLWNPGATELSPKITTDSEFIIKQGSRIYELETGVSQSTEFRLKLGENKLTLTGNGTISFEFYKELI